MRGLSVAVKHSSGEKANLACAMAHPDCPPHMTEPRDAERWAVARSFQDLCELGAQFIEGRISFFPGWGSSTTDLESDAVGQVLAEVNRGGCLTLASQRGESTRAGADGRPEQRRSFLLGLASDEALGVLNSIVGAGHYLGHYPATEADSGSLPVGKRGDDVFLDVGAPAGPTELQLFKPHLHRLAYGALSRSHYVILADLTWGSPDNLWKTLSKGFPTKGSR